MPEFSFWSGKGSQPPADAPTPPKLKLTYWQIRGLAAPLRMMLSFADIPFEETRYAWGQAGDWFGTDKPALQGRNALANLPNITNDSGVVTQSNACFMYVARMTGLAGTDSDQLTKIEQVLFDTYDLRDALCNMVYWYKGFCRNKGEFDEQKGKYFAEKAMPFFDKQENWLGQVGSTFFTGDAPTAADFHVWEQLDQHIDLASDVGAASPLEGREKLAAFYAAFKALPQLANYFASDAYGLVRQPSVLPARARA